jgi:hypothetical protein
MGKMLGDAAHGGTVTLLSERKEITVPADTLRTYAGTYELNPKFALTLTVENDQLMAQATNQPKFPLFAESERRFFLKVVEAEVEFMRDDKGAVTHLILYQNGREMKGVRK